MHVHAPAVRLPPSLGIDEGSLFHSRAAVASLLQGPRPTFFVVFRSQGRGARHVHALYEPLPSTFGAGTDIRAIPNARAAIFYYLARYVAKGAAADEAREEEEAH